MADVNQLELDIQSHFQIYQRSFIKFLIEVSFQHP